MATRKPSQDIQYTKYEIARIIGARALQISMNAPILLSLKKSELESMEYDSLRIAEKEFRSGILPITVKRPLPEMRETEETDEEIEEEKDEPSTELATEVEEEKKVAEVTGTDKIQKE